MVQEGAGGRGEALVYIYGYVFLQHGNWPFSSFAIKTNFCGKIRGFGVGGIQKFKSSFSMGSSKSLCLRASVPPMSDFFPKHGFAPK